MIRSNLAIILAEKKLKITKVSHDTGLSRTTLTALAQNNCKGLQFDTLNTLCLYLGVKPADLIQYVPIDINNFTFESEEFVEFLPDFKGLLMFDLYSNNKKYTACLKIYCSLSSYTITDENSCSTFIEDIYSVEILESEDIYDNKVVLSYLKKLPRTFLTDLDQQILPLMYKEVQFMKTEAKKRIKDGMTKWTILEDGDL